MSKIAVLRQYVRHKRDCRINPGGRIMEALGDPEKRPCSCGLDAALSAASKAGKVVQEMVRLIEIEVNPDRPPPFRSEYRNVLARYRVLWGRADE